MQRPVLLVIDMLNDFLDRWPADARERLIESSRDLIGALRRHGSPVIWVRQEFEPDLRDAFLEMRTKRVSVTIRGTPGC
jgi:nicotinamidase-related amidase